MATEAPKNKPSFWQRQFYVHKIQKTYAIWFGLFMFVSSLLVFVLAYLAAFIPPAMKLLSPAPLEERAMAAKQFIFVAQTVLPGLVVLIPASAVFSIYLTHRMAGPLFRIEETARAMIRGNLSQRIRLRKKDELHELASLINDALTSLEQSFQEIRQSDANLRQALSWVLDEVKKQPSINRQVVDRLETALKSENQIEVVLKRFQLSEPHA